MRSTRTRLAAATVGAVASLALAVPAFALDTASGAGAGSIVARGNGTATVTGDLDKLVATGQGALIVTDRAGDAVITVSGRGVKKVSGNVTSYAGFNGTATITGSDVTVQLAGVRVRMAATGDGSFTLKGTGSYDAMPGVAGGEGAWTKSGTTIDL
jgi:hypothetical protein